MKTRKIVHLLAALFVSFASLVASPKRNADGKRYYHAPVYYFEVSPLYPTPEL